MYENLSEFDKALAKFADKAGVLAGLEITNKITEDEAFENIKALYKELKKIKKSTN
jgi:hypothetical protein